MFNPTEDRTHDWRYTGTTTAPNSPLLIPNATDESSFGNLPQVNWTWHQVPLLVPFVPDGRLRAMERARQSRAKKRKRRRILAKAQRKHLVALKGKRAVGKMLAYNRRRRPVR